MCLNGSNTDSKGECHILLRAVSDVTKNDHFLLSTRQPPQGPHKGVTLRDIGLGISSRSQRSLGSVLADLGERKVPQRAYARAKASTATASAGPKPIIFAVALRTRGKLLTNRSSNVVCSWLIGSGF